MSFIPRPHEIYRHFKGDLYQVTAVAEHTETGEQLVIYQALYGDFKTYARPLAMFVSRVDRKKNPEAQQDFRFQLQGPEAGRQQAETDEEGAASGQAEAGGYAAVQVRQEAASWEGAMTGRQEAVAGEGTATERPEDGVSATGRAKAQAAAENGDAAGEEDAEEGELALDPMLLEFLDSDSYEEKLNILAGLHHRITDEMLTTMAIACDIEISSGEIEERYEALKACLLTLEHYECNRLR